ncbi:MAG: hypothetical protein QNK79_08795 [Synechococcus sp. ArSW.bin.68]
MISRPCSLAAYLIIDVSVVCPLMHEKKFTSCLHFWMLGTATLKAFISNLINPETQRFFAEGSSAVPVFRFVPQTLSA